MVQWVAEALGELNKEVVFVGGATTTFYIDDPGAPSTTPSDDVDFIVEVTSQIEYSKLEKILRGKGFKDPIGEDNPPICRKMLGDISVDVMPTDPKILGFSNKWYPDGLKNKIQKKLPNETEINLFSLPYFLATKFTAFQSRGTSDPRMSQDMEDIIAVLDGSKTFDEQLEAAPPEVKKYIQEQFRALLKDEDQILEVAEGFLRAGGTSAARARLVIQRMKKHLGT